MDGHYGSFPELDWIGYWGESLLTPGVTTTVGLGLNPMVLGMRTTYDGGKVVGGYGMLTGTVTNAWVMKVWGSYSCTGTATVLKATGYSAMTINATNTTQLTMANCNLSASWIWTAKSNNTVAFATATSTMVVDVAEAWASGTQTVTNTASGTQSIFYAVGGINQNQSYGLGVWNMMVWGMDKTGTDMTGALMAANAADWVK